MALEPISSRLRRASAAVAAVVTIYSVAAPPPEPGSTSTMQGENDRITTTPGGSDKFYTSGLRLGWASGTDDVAEFTVRTAQTLWGDGITRISFDLTQQIYSPTNTARRTFLTDQRYRNSRRKT